LVVDLWKDCLTPHPFPTRQPEDIAMSRNQRKHGAVAPGLMEMGRQIIAHLPDLEPEGKYMLVGPGGDRIFAKGKFLIEYGQGLVDLIEAKDRNDNVEIRKVVDRVKKLVAEKMGETMISCVRIGRPRDGDGPPTGYLTAVCEWCKAPVWASPDTVRQVERDKAIAICSECAETIVPV
jgi:hypothetical protein